MMCLYKRPDKVMVRVSSSIFDKNDGLARNYKPDEVLWGKRAGDLAEGVYDDAGNFLGGFKDYWHAGLSSDQSKRPATSRGST